MDTLCDDTTSAVLAFLDASSLGGISCVSSPLRHHMSTHDELWRGAVEMTYAHLVEELDDG